MAFNEEKIQFPGLVNTVTKDLEQRFDSVHDSIRDINIEKGSVAHFSEQTKRAGKTFGVSKNHCARDAEGKPCLENFVSDSMAKYMDKRMNALVQSGKTSEEAFEIVKDSIAPALGYDRAKNQYVVAGVVRKEFDEEAAKATMDSLLERTSVPSWNIGWMNKIIQQPFATSHAKNLVSVESFNNPWADVIGLFTESFEGYGKLSSTAKGNFKQNNSNPVTNRANQIVDEVFNISVDYESDPYEDIMQGKNGNFITGQLKADRERYAKMVLDRMQDALIYFGSREAGISGLVDVAAVEMYTGTPMDEIIHGNSKTKGSDIVEAFINLVSDFQRANHYMARQIRINVSEHVFQALTSTQYSKEFDAQSPLEVIKKHFNAQKRLGNDKLISEPFELVVDTMLNPNTPYNPNPYDLMFITTPNIEGAMGTQSSLVIHPELLDSFVVPAQWQRQGMLYTMYKRIGGVIAPLEGTVKVIEGFGYQGM